MDEYRYAAFITYSHGDAKVAAWLQKSLESYRVPAHFRAASKSRGKTSRHLGRIFRDREELSAGGDLGDTISNALLESEFLIVVCSPASARSEWVNREIAEFKKTHTADKIFCVIVAGEPFASQGNPDSPEECFPPALEYQLSRESGSSDVVEPVAADIRKGADGKRLAKLKIIAGILGVGLDSIIQRDAQRRNRRLLGLSVASLTGMVVMTVLSIAAIDARNAEQERRAEAEDLIEFMLGDLRDRLQAVGRLDVLDAVGNKAVDYYSQMDLDDHTDSSLGRRARAFHLLGEVDDLSGDMEAARSRFEEAYESTGELVRRSPYNGNLVFDHAQSVFWVGYLDWRLGNLAGAESAFLEYLRLAGRLSEIDPDNIDWIVEAAHAGLNLGVYSLQTGDPAAATQYFEQALAVYQQVAEKDPDNAEWPWLVAQAHAWLADAYVSNGSLEGASSERSAEVGLYRQLLAEEPGDKDVQLSLITSYRQWADILVQQGDVANAVEHLQEARLVADQLSALDPDNTLTAQERASIYSDLGEAISFSVDSALSPPLFDTAKEIVDGLISLDQNVMEWQELSHKIQIRQSKLAGALSRGGAQVMTIKGLIETLANLAMKWPDALEIRYLLADARFLLAVAQERAGNTSQMQTTLGLIVSELSDKEATLPPRMLALLSRSLRLQGDNVRSDELATKLENIGFQHPEYVHASRK